MQMEKMRKTFRKVSEIVKKHKPEILCAVGVASLIDSMMINPPKRKSNNWLKMHGYPMRRRIRG